MESACPKKELICCLKSAPSFIVSRSKRSRNRFWLWACNASLSCSSIREAACASNVDGVGPGGGVVCAARVEQVSRTINASIAPLRTFTALRTVKDYPDQKVLSEILKAMHFTRRGKKRVTGAKLKALAFHRKPASTSYNNVKLIARMRLLQINALGRVDLNRQGAVAKEFSIEFSVARGDGVVRVGKFDDGLRRNFNFV